MHEKPRARPMAIRAIKQYLKDVETMNRMLPKFRKDYPGHWVAVYCGKLVMATQDKEKIARYRKLVDNWPAVVFIHPALRS